MNVFAFDIDGTLLDSSDVDSRLYLESVERVLGNVELRSHWSDYEHVTDQGLLKSIILDNRLEHESLLIGKVKREFFQALKDYLNAHGPFRQIPGAREFVESLRRSDNTRIVYATGGWRDSASLKLQTSGFPLEGIPLGCSDDHDDRPSIMRNAVASLSVKPHTITYYGDGTWDKVACEKLGWRFVAVGMELGGIEDYRTDA
ncbi:MAG: HAD family hydrolase [Wenzhouxiangellaceae bacterium]|nr:HAD family hydrolase [Wenzhouxiangellaceae bacterium]